MLTKTETPIALQSFQNKADWLGARYFRIARDELFSEKLQALFKLADDNTPTANPRRDPLTGETLGLQVIGRSGTGKSSLLTRTLNAQPTLRLFTPENAGNALLVTVPPEATSKSLAEKVASATGYRTMATRVKAFQAWEIVRHRLQMLGITLLVIDEAHHLLRPGPGRDIPGVLQTLKHLLQGEGSPAVVLAGVDKLRVGLRQDLETDRRFKPFEITPVYEGSNDAHRFDACLRACARNLGLVWTDASLSDRILFAEHGNIGMAIFLAKQLLLHVAKAERVEVTLRDASAVYHEMHPGVAETPFTESDWSKVHARLSKAGWAE